MKYQFTLSKKQIKQLRDLFESNDTECEDDLDVVTELLFVSGGMNSEDLDLREEVEVKEVK